MEQTDKLYHRIKVGRPARFESAEQFWLEALEAFAWFDSHPLRMDVRDKKRASSEGDKTAEKTYVEVQRPYTIDGLLVYLNVQTTWTDMKRNYSKRPDWPEFYAVFNACEQCVRNNQVTGAMIGLYSERLTARLNGISDKFEQVVETRATMTWEDVRTKMAEAKDSIKTD